MDVTNSKSINGIVPLIENNLRLQVFNAQLQSGLVQIDEESDVANFDVAVPYLLGTPGGGKTAIIKEMCQKNNWQLLSCHLGLMPLEELSGIPNFEKIEINGQEVTGTVWSIPEVLCEVHKLSNLCKKDEIVVFFCDDMHLAGPTIMSLLYRFLTEREIKNFKLPDNVGVIMAGNYGNKTGAKVMYSAICNRVIMMPVHSDFNEWKNNFAIKNKIHSAVISFLQQNERFFHEEELVDSAWSSPRSWSRLSTMIKSYEIINKNQIPMDLCQYLATGHVGSDTAAEFTKYYHLFMKFDIDGLLKDPDSFDINKMTSNDVEIYTLGLAIVSSFTGKKKPNYEKYAKLFEPFFGLRPEACMIMLKEVESTEMILGKKSMYSNLLIELQKINPVAVKTLIKEVNDAIYSSKD